MLCNISAYSGTLYLVRLGNARNSGFPLHVSLLRYGRYSQYNFEGITFTGNYLGFPMLTVILANIWHGTAFSMLNFQSALDHVPRDMEEAARVDGANRLQVLWHLLIPCMKQTIGMNTMLNTFSTLGVFGLIWAMTGGGPGNKTTTLSIYMYNAGMKNFQLGKGTAIGILILLLGGVCSIGYSFLFYEREKTSRRNFGKAKGALAERREA